MAQAANPPAKPPAKPEAPSPAPAPEAAPKRGGKTLLIIVLIVVFLLLLAVLAIGALLVLKKGGGSNHDTATVENVAVPAPVPVQQLTPTVDLHKPPTFAPLEQFTVNLASEEGDDGRYLQALIVLKVGDPQTAEALKGWMPEIRHRINLLLSSKRPSEVQDIRGREGLANEIQIQINAMLGVPPPQEGTSAPLVSGPIQAVLFNSFIIQ
jgi:flagellar FliL protein